MSETPVPNPEYWLKDSLNEARQSLRDVPVWAGGTKVPNPNPGKVPLTVPVTVNLPEGYELADTKMRPSHAGEWYLDNSIGGARRRVGEEHPNAMRVILRPIQPATVNGSVLVEMSRDDARRSAERCSIHDFNLEECDTNNLRCRLAVSARAAIARKPCPVMVHNDRSCCIVQGKPYPDDDTNRHSHPCKLEAGHGGEHE